MSVTTERTGGAVVYKSRGGDLVIPESLKLSGVDPRVGQTESQVVFKKPLFVDRALESPDIQLERSLSCVEKVGRLFPAHYLRAMFSVDRLIRPKWGLLEALMAQRIDRQAVWELDQNW